MSKRTTRINDHRFFIKNLPSRFRHGKNIHHDWEHGARCYFLEVEIHNALHGIGVSN